MTLLTQELLLETTASVLADCAFLMLDPTSELRPVAGEAVVTTLSFSGSARGTLRLCTTRQLLLGAAADMVGQPADPAQASQEAEATLAELANVLLGVLLARAFGAAQAPLIGLPHSATVAAVSREEGAHCSALLVDMDGQPFVASLSQVTETAA
jgi:hypothetical protein